LSAIGESARAWSFFELVASPHGPRHTFSHPDFTSQRKRLYFVK
jgi:hypothetical protein